MPTATEVEVEVTLPEQVIAKDKKLTESVSKGNDALGKLRYEWCVTKGVKRSTYAELVGVSPQAVNASITRHMNNNGIVYSAPKGDVKRGRGRPAGSKNSKPSVSKAGATKARTYAGKPIAAADSNGHKTPAPTFTEAILEMETEAVELVFRAKAERLSGRERTKAKAALRKLEAHVAELRAVLDASATTGTTSQRHLTSVGA